MLARIHRSMEEKDEGFTLIELLVVMIIIGILAAIAIPVFLNQRKKAQDTATKSDVSTIGKELATYYVDNTSAPTVAFDATAGKFTLAGNDIKTSSNVAITATFSPPAALGRWCVYGTNDQGDKAKSAGFQYSELGGLTEGKCA